MINYDELVYWVYLSELQSCKPSQVFEFTTIMAEKVIASPYCDTDTDTDTDTRGSIMTILWNVINCVAKWFNAHNCENT